MRRIGVAVVLAVSLSLAPLTAEAQQPRKIAKVGVLAMPLTDDPEFRVLWEAFTGGLRDYGWIENQNVVFERRMVAEGPERYSRPAAELVALHPDIIISGLGEPAILALRKATTTIPIVMLVAADPVGTGLIANLARPGGNVTGMSMLAPELGGKRLAILKEAVATATQVAVLWNAAYPGKAAEFRDSEATATALKVKLQSVEVRGPNDFHRAFSSLGTWSASSRVSIASGTSRDGRGARYAQCCERTVRVPRRSEKKRQEAKPVQPQLPGMPPPLPPGERSNNLSGESAVAGDTKRSTMNDGLLLFRPVAVEQRYAGPLTGHHSSDARADSARPAHDQRIARRAHF